MKNSRFDDVRVVGIPFDIREELDAIEFTEESECQEFSLPSVSERKESCDRALEFRHALFEKFEICPDTRTSSIKHLNLSSNNSPASKSPDLYIQNQSINVDTWKVFKKCRKGGTNIVEKVRKIGENSYNARKTRYLESLRRRTANTTPVRTCKKSSLNPVSLDKRKISKGPTKSCFNPCAHS